MYIEILDNFLIPSIENCFADDEVILRTMIYIGTEKKGIKAFLKSITTSKNFRFKYNWYFMEHFFLMEVSTNTEREKKKKNLKWAEHKQ